MAGEVAITNGNGSELIIGDEFIFARFSFGPDKEARVNIGPATKKQIEVLQSNLERLKIHARD